MAVGAGMQGVALMTALVNFILAFLCIKAPAIVEKIGPTKRGVILLSCLSTYAWSPIILLFLFLMPELAPFWLGVLWLVNLAPAVLIEILRDSWLANLIPSDYVGRYLGKRLAITSISHLSTFLVMGYILDNSGWRLEASFATIFTISLVASFVSFVIYSRMHDLPAAKEKNGKNLGFSTFVSELKDKKLNRFMLFVSLFRFTVNFGGPLYAVYMLNELNFSYSTFAIVLSAEYLARITSGHFWGQLADRVGNIKVISLVSRLIPIIPVLWLFSPNAVYLMFVQMLSGACWAAFDLCNQGYIYKVAPASKKLLYVVYSRSIGLMMVALGGLFGVYLLKNIPPLAGSQIFSIFLLSGIFRLVVVALMAHQLIDYALPLNEPRTNPNVDIAAALRKMARKVGLYYHPEKWGEFAPVPVYSETNAAFLSPETATSNLGLYYRPQEWQEFFSVAPSPETSVAAASARVATKRALYHLNPPEWQELVGITPPPETSVAAASARVATAKPVLRNLRPMAQLKGINGVAPSPVADAAKASARVTKSKQGLHHNRRHHDLAKPKLQPVFVLA
ncbi:MAG: MFS transporter [Chloroflexota bacterium]